MRRRRGLYDKPAEPVAIDDYTGFKVPLSALKKDWTGLLTTDPDIRNPQDFVRGVPDNQALPYARPEVPDVFLAEPLITEDDIFIEAEQGGEILFSEGLTVTL